MPQTFINGFDLYYNIYGSGPPLIFIHGLGMDQSMWDLQIPQFAPHYQVILYDLRGHGASESPPHPYSIELFADDLHLFLRFLGLKKAIILGLSLGGRILLKFALKYPEESKALILCDAQSETPEESKQRFQWLAEIAQKEGMEKAAEAYFALPLFQTLATKNPARLEREKERFIKTSALGFAQSCLAIAQMEPLTGLLDQIKAPTLALAGEWDTPYLPFLDIYAAQITNCQKRIIPQAGHLSNLENPLAFQKAIQEFLEGLPRE